MNGTNPESPRASSPSERYRFGFALLGLLLLAAAPATTAAQIITGTVTVEGTGAPARGAWIAVLDSLEQQQNAALTDASGRFSVRVAGFGPVHLRAQLIGHTDAVSGVLELGPGEARSISLTMRERALPLDAITVEAERRCEVSPEAGAAAVLWDEVKKALEAVRLTGDASLVTYRVERFQRRYGLDNVLQTESLDTVVSRGARPFRTLPPSQLVRRGYVQGDASPVFYAPDADVLLSDGFVATHCFRARRGRGETAAMVGLGFEPNADRRLPDVAGTLWVDTATSALRFLEFGYAGIDYGPRTRDLGGRLDFTRLESGAWIVEKWWIRGPVLFGYDASVLVDPSRRRSIGGFMEAGAQVIEIVSERGRDSRPGH